MIYSEDPYLGITKPLPLFDSIIYPKDKDTYVEVQMYKKKSEKYYEVVLHNKGISIYIGKFIKEDDFFGVMHKNGNILLYNENYNYKKHKMNIVKVLALYNIEDDTFYYCSEKDAIKMFDSDIDFEGLKKPNNKLLITQLRKKVLEDTDIYAFQNSFSKKTDEKELEDKPKILKLTL